MKIPIASKKTLRLIIIGLLLLIVISGIVAIFISSSNVQKKNDVTSGPSFDSLLPTGKAIEDLGGWQVLTPPNSEPTYVFVDSIGDVSITVSQQVLPETFKSSPSASIQELAKNYSATEELDAGGTKIYIGTSSKGPQSVIFTKKDLLLLIKSQARIDNDAWVKYINSLS